MLLPSRSYSILVYAFLLMAGTVCAQWTKTNGPNGGTVLCLAKKGSFTFAGTSGGGVYRSADGGNTWTQCNQGLSMYHVSALAVSGNNLFAGTRDNVIYRSADDGATWTISRDWNESSKVIYAFVVKGPVILAGTSRSTVYRSVNGGDTWTEHSGIYGIDFKIVSFAVQGDAIFAAATGGNNSCVLRSVNNGAGWKNTVEGTHTGNPICLAADDSVLYVGNASGVGRSSDQGLSWTQNSPDHAQFSVESMAIHGSGLLVGTDRFGVLRINDTVAEPVNTGMPAAFIQALMVDGGSILAGAKFAGIFRSNDSGKTWARRNTGLACTGITAIVTKGSRLFAGIEGVGISRSSDNGATWTDPDTALTDSRVSLAVAGSTIFAGTENKGVFRSLDDGATWASSQNGMNKPTISCLASDGLDIFAGTLNHGVFRSLDGGATWSQAFVGLADSSILKLFVHDHHVFAVTVDQGVYRSDGGSWKTFGNGVPKNFYKPEFAAKGGLLFAGLDRGGLFVSSDNGDHWTQVSDNSPNPPISVMGAFNGELLAAGSGGPMRFAADSSSWAGFDQGWPAGNQVTAFAALGDKVFAGTSESGVWVRPLSDIPTALVSHRIPPRYPHLEWIAGGRLGTGSIIRFVIGNPSMVDLSVFDGTGRKVETLVYGRLDAGMTQVPLRAKDLSQGAYFLRLSANDYCRTRKFQYDK